MTLTFLSTVVQSLSHPERSKTKMQRFLAHMLLSITFLLSTDGFASRARPSWGLLSSVNPIEKLSSESVDPWPDLVQAPLKFAGPYPCLSLHFSHLATEIQRDRNETGVNIDFVLDTAANVNMLQASIAETLNLTVVRSVVPGLGFAGAFAGGQTCRLGNAELEEVPEVSPFVTGLTAAAVPMPMAGVLSWAFFQSFDSVEFAWGKDKDGKVPEKPSATFYGATFDDVFKGKKCVPIQPIEVCQLPSVTIRVNGAEMPALLDTGSPITVLNAKAAELAGIETAHTAADFDDHVPDVAGKFDEATASSCGKLLSIMGLGGERINLHKTPEKVHVELPTRDVDAVDFGSGHIFVGDLPGLALLNGLGVESPPAVVLGLDVLRQRRTMMVRAPSNEVWFE